MSAGESDVVPHYYYATDCGTDILTPTHCWVIRWHSIDAPCVALVHDDGATGGNTCPGLYGRSRAEFNKGNWSLVVNLTAQMCCWLRTTTTTVSCGRGGWLPLTHVFCPGVWMIAQDSFSQFGMFYNCQGVDYINH